MSRIYLSFLGNNPYTPCTYYRDKEFEVSNVRFVQEATIAIYCREWAATDRIRIFTTPDAYKKNWLDGYFLDKTTNQLLEGLCTRIQKLAPVPKVKNVPIPEGKNEEEIWDIFTLVYNEIEQGDIVVLDITHAFRSIPLLASVVLNYAKVLKDVSIEGIYYGAFEVLGNPRDVSKMPLEERRVPIFDLTCFNALQDWTLAIDRFLGAGDAGPACDLATRSVRPILAATKGQDKAAAGIKRVAQGLKDLSQAISTCRGDSLSGIAISLKGEIGAYGNLDLLPALRPLIGRIGEKISLFRGEPIHDGIQAARWCLEHNLIQQGYTILNEALITHCLQKIGGDPMNHHVRELVLYAAKVHKDGAGDPQADLDLLESARGFFRSNKNLAKIMRGLSDRRNELNHAGFRDNAMPPQRFAPNLSEFIEKVRLELA